MEIIQERDAINFKTPADEWAKVRPNGTVVSASNWYYSFVRENSILSIFELIDSADSSRLSELMSGYLSDDAKKSDDFFAEFITSFTNKLGDTFPICYIAVKLAEETESGNVLFEVRISDLRGMGDKLELYRKKMAKYHFFMSIKDEMYFEYRPSDGNFVVYKYTGGSCYKLVDEDFSQYIEKTQKPLCRDDKILLRQLDTVCSYIYRQEKTFRTTFDFTDETGEFRSAKVIGGFVAGERDMIAGVYIPDKERDSEKYYLSSAAVDPGTGLLNKRAISEYAAEMIGMIKDTDQKAWMMIIDIDDFKRVNDNFGHLFGDEVIRYTANTLSEEIGENGMVGRFGGDEFFAFVHKIPERDDIKILLKSIAKRLAIHFDPKVKITLSIGAAKYPDDGTELDEIFAKADKALYIAKEKGKDRHIIYEEKLHGGLSGDSMQSQAVSYAVSREKKRQLLCSLMTRIAMEDEKVVTGDASVQMDIRTLFDLDGITIVTDFCKTVVVSNGKYIGEPGFEGVDEWLGEKIERFGESGRYVENNVSTLQYSNPDIYRHMRSAEIGACIICVEYVDGRIHTLMSFDQFNKNRKWSDNDIDGISLIGHTITRLIKQKRVKERRAISF